MERERVNPATERENARNMALLQAGLAIAGGTSPHFAQNLAAGAIPAMQSYQTQVTNLRKEGRDELKAQFDLARADVEAQYHQGMLNEHQLKTRLEYLSTQETNALRQRIATEGNTTQIEAARIAAGGRGDRPTDLGNHVRALMEANPTMSRADAYDRAIKSHRGGDTNTALNNLTNQYMQRVRDLSQSENEQLRGVLSPDHRKVITDRFAAQRRQLDSMYSSRGVVIPEVEQPAASSSSMQTFPLFPERR
jgi:hypothetical protein